MFSNVQTRKNQSPAVSESIAKLKLEVEIFVFMKVKKYQHSKRKHITEERI